MSAASIHRMQVQDAEAAIIPTGRLPPTIAVNKHPVDSPPLRVILPIRNLPMMMMIMRMAGSVLGIGRVR
jgi:hypothetical protein